MFEYLDSFRQTNRSYAAGSAVQYGVTSPNGVNATIGYSGSFNIGVRRNVTARTQYGQCGAVTNPASPTTLILPFFKFREQAGTVHVTVMFNAAGKIEVRRGTETGTLLATSTNVERVDGGYGHYGAEVTVHASAGTVDVWSKGVPCPGLTGLTGLNTDNGSAHTIDQMEFGDCTSASVRGSVGFAYWGVWNKTGGVNTTYPGQMIVAAGTATGNGSNTSATASSGTLASCVDEIPHNSDGDYVAQDDTGLPKTVSFAMTDAPAGTITILATQHTAVVRSDDIGTNTGRLVVISGGTTQDGGADIGLGTGYAEVMRINDVDPNTSAAWGTAGYNAHELGWKRTA